jgi:hypothetical protein
MEAIMSTAVMKNAPAAATNGRVASGDASWRTNPVVQAFWLLRLGFTVAPILFGLDKFAHVLVDWDRYLAPEFADVLPWTTHELMFAAWLGGIIVNLLMQADYYDIALRDFGLLLGALTLARLASAFRPGLNRA